VNIRPEAERSPYGHEKTFVEVSFVLPCLNEAATIEACVRECAETLQASRVAGEVVVADNGSTDGSQEIAKRAGARVMLVSKRGYGSALIEGIRAAKGKYVVMGDSDLSYDFREMSRFLEKLREGHELVIGCRMARGGGTTLPGAMPFLHRWLGNPALSALGRLLFRTDVIDFHCGIRGFERERVLNLNLRTSGMEFASEMVVKAILAKFRIAQVPVTLRPDGRNHPPHLRTWQDGWRHLRFMLLHAPRWLFLYPGLAMMLLSTTAFAILLSGPVDFRGIRFDTNTLMVCAVGVMAGFQVTLFGLFSELYSRIAGLLPPSPLAERMLKFGPFEKGLLIGAPLFLGGTVCLFLALLKWRHASFGNLTYPDTLRLIISSLTGISLGIQIIFGGFILAVLGVKANSD
jgi:glycosyltransferase involved in cell wall biosynthesis